MSSFDSIRPTHSQNRNWSKDLLSKDCVKQLSCAEPPLVQTENATLALAGRMHLRY